MRAMQFPTVPALPRRVILAALLGALLAMAATPPATAESVAGITEHDQPGLFPPEYREGYIRWLKSPGEAISVVLHDPASGYAYTACNGRTAFITKVALGDDSTPPRLVGELALDAWEEPITAGAIDPTTGHAYFATVRHSSAQLGRLVKVRLGVGEELPTRVGAEPTLDTIRSLAIDPERGCAYATANPRLFKYRLGGDDEPPTTVAGRTGVASTNFLLLNTAAGYGVVVQRGGPARSFFVHRFELTGPENGDLTFVSVEFPDLGLPIWAVLDDVSGLLYVCTEYFDNVARITRRFLHVLTDADEQEVFGRLSFGEVPQEIDPKGTPYLDRDNGAIYVARSNVFERFALQPENTAPVHDLSIPVPTVGTNSAWSRHFDPASGLLLLGYTRVANGGPVFAQGLLNAADITIAGSAQLPPPLTPLSFTLHVPSTGDLILGTGTQPPHIVRVPDAHFEDFERPVPRRLVSEWESAPRCAVLDDATLQLLVGLGETSGQVAQVFVGVDDEPFVIGAMIDLDADESNLNCAVFDRRSRVALFATDTTPGRIVVVAPGEEGAPPTRLGAIALEAGEDRFVRAVLDEAAGYAYFITRSPDARVVKVALGQEPGELPRRASAVQLDVEGTIRDLQLHAEAGHLYVLASASSRIYRLDLGDGDDAPTQLASVPVTPGIVRHANVLRPDLNALFMNTDYRVIGVHHLGVDGRMPELMVRYTYPATTLTPLAFFHSASVVPGTDRMRFIGDAKPPYIAEVEARDRRYAHMARVELPENGAVHALRVYSHRAVGNLRMAIFDDAQTPLGFTVDGTLKQLNSALLGYRWPYRRLWESPVVTITAEEDWLEVPVPSQGGQALDLPPGTYWLGWQVDTQAIPVSRVPFASSTRRAVRIPWDWGAFPNNAVSGFDGQAYSDQVNAWSAHLVYDLLPVVASIKVLPRGGPGVAMAGFEVRFNTPVQGAEDAGAFLVSHNGTAHATIAVEGEGDTRVVTVGGLTGRGTFTLSVRLDGGVQSLDGMPLQESLVSAPVMFLQDYWDGGASGRHALDTNNDGRFSLSELLRLIQFYNAGGLHCAALDAPPGDSFEAGYNATARDCLPHSSDYAPHDWRISLSELLRAVQIYNAGGYHPCPGVGEDGFCVGPAPG